jgi:hypothetical protein
MLKTHLQRPYDLNLSNTAEGKRRFISLLSDFNKLGGKKICWVGDSITEQGLPEIGNGIGFTTYIEDLYPNIYYNQGRGGQTTIDVIANIQDLLDIDADCYVVAIGVNDARYNDSRGATTQAEYIANMTSIANSLSSNGAYVVIISIWPTFYMDQFANLKRFATDQRMVEWNMAAAKLAASLGHIFIDAYTTIKKYVTLFNVDSLTTDGVHPIYTDTEMKQLYAYCVLGDNIPAGLLSSEYTLSSASTTHYFKLVIHNPDPANVRGTGGYCGIQHINVLPYYKEFIAKTANTAYPSTSLFGTYSSSYTGFYNLASDFPITIHFAADQWPSSAGTTGIVSGPSNAHRGIRTYGLYFSSDRDAFGNDNHPSWRLVHAEPKTNAIAVNLLPKVRNSIFYKLSFTSFGNSQTTLKLASLTTASLPVRVWYDNVSLAGAHRYPLLFSTGITVEAQAITATTLPLNICWEAEEELTSIVMTDFNSSIGAWTLSKSYIESDIALPASSTWNIVSTGTGAQTITPTILPRLVSHGELTNRDIAGNHSKLIPLADSTTAEQITKADGMTVVLNADTTNSRVGINITDPACPLEVLSASQKALYLRDAGLAHGMTTLGPTNVFFSAEEYGGVGSGGAIFRCLAGNSNSTSAVFFQGVQGHTTPIVPAIMFRGGKKSGTGYNFLAAGEGVVGFDNYTTRLMTLLGSGFFGIGINPPTSRLHVHGSEARKSDTLSTGTTLDATHNVVYCDGTFNVTLPTTACTDRIYTIKNIGAGTITIIGTIDGASNPTLATQYAGIVVHYNGSAWYKIGAF